MGLGGALNVQHMTTIKIHSMFLKVMMVAYF